MKKHMLFIFLLMCVSLFAQHVKTYQGISAPHDHNTNNCYGYALGRAEGKLKGDHFCEPQLTHANGIPSYYTFSQNILGVQVGDILAWGSIFLSNPYGPNDPNGHVAYVVSVPNNLNFSNIGNIMVDQVPYTGGAEQKGVYVFEITNQGSPVGFFNVPRGVTFRATFANDFEGEEGGVILLRNPLLKDDYEYHEKNHPHHEYCSIYGTEILDIKAVNHQEMYNEVYEFDQWNKDGAWVSNNIEMLFEQISMSVVYEAIFDEYIEPLLVDVTGPTILIGSQGLIKAPQYHATGTWTASASGGVGSYIYQWQYYGYYGWTDYVGETNYSMTKTLYYDPEGHDLRCVVNSGSETAYDEIHVFVTNGISLKTSPNPFNPITNIDFIITDRSKVKIEIYNIRGNKIKTLINNEYCEGNYSVKFNASNLESGVYICKMVSETITTKDVFTSIKRLILLK